MKATRPIVANTAIEMAKPMLVDMVNDWEARLRNEALILDSGLVVDDHFVFTHLRVFSFFVGRTPASHAEVGQFFNAHTQVSINRYRLIWTIQKCFNSSLV
jgi:hypothetical protein